MAQSKDNRDPQQNNKSPSQGSIQQGQDQGKRDSQMNQQSGRADQGGSSNPSDIEDEDMDEDLPSGQRGKQDNQNRKG